MANTYKWIINRMDCYPENPKPKCVHTIHWGIVATRDDINPINNRPYMASTAGAIHIPYEANDSFTPHEELTEEKAISFVQEAMKKHILNAELDGWTLTEIQKDRVLLEQNNQSKELLLQKSKPKELFKNLSIPLANPIPDIPPPPEALNPFNTPDSPPPAAGGFENINNDNP